MIWLDQAKCCGGRGQKKEQEDGEAILYGRGTLADTDQAAAHNGQLKPQTVATVTATTKPTGALFAACSPQTELIIKHAHNTRNTARSAASM
jgi:hypothetical protein